MMLNSTMTLALTSRPSGGGAVVPGSQLTNVTTEMGAAPVLDFSAAFSPNTQSSGRYDSITDLASGIVAVRGTAGTPGTVTDWHGPYARTDLLGRPFMRGEGNEYLTVPATYAFAADQRTRYAILVVCRIHRPNNVATIFGFGSENQANTKNAQAAFVTRDGYIQANGNDGRADPKFNTMQPGTEVQVLAVVGRTTALGGCSMWVNGDKTNTANSPNGQPVAMTGNLTSAEIFRNGASNASSQQPQEMGAGLPADIYRIMVFHGDFTDTQVGNAVAKLQADWDTQTKTDAAFFEGASAMFGSTIAGKLDVSTSGTCLAMLATEPGSPHALGPTWHAFSPAAAGNNTAALVARRDAARSWVNFLRSGKNVYTGHHGINDYPGLDALGSYNAQKALYYTTTTGYLQRGLSIFRVANLATSNGAMQTAFLDPLNDKFIANYATFLTDLDAAPGGAYDGKVKVMDGRLIQVGARFPFRATADNNAIEYQDGTHFTKTGNEELMSGGDTPQYGWARALMAAFP